MGGKGKEGKVKGGLWDTLYMDVIWVGWEREKVDYHTPCIISPSHTTQCSDIAMHLVERLCQKAALRRVISSSINAQLCNV